MLGVGLGLGGAGRRGFDLKGLFAQAAGGWWNAGAPGSLFEDAGGTMPARVNAPVGLMLDRSGRGNHLVQASAAARPMLRVDETGRAFLEFDGTNDALVRPASELSITGALTLVAKVRREANGRFDVWLSSQTNAGAANQYELRSEPGGKLELVSADATRFEVDGAGACPTGRSCVLTAVRADGVVRLAVDGAEVAQAHTVQASADAQSEFRLGSRRGSPLFVRGRIYAALAIGRALSPTELDAARRLIASAA